MKIVWKRVGTALELVAVWPSPPATPTIYARGRFWGLSLLWDAWKSRVVTKKPLVVKRDGEKAR